MYVLIVMIVAGDLTLTLVDTLDGHTNPLFVGDVGRVEEWFFVHDDILCAKGKEAVRAKLPELSDQSVGHEIKVLYTPEPSRHRYHRPADGAVFRGGL